MTAGRPYKPSWLDAFLDWVNSLKMAPVLFYILLYLLIVLAIHVALWLEGGLDFGAVETRVFFDVIWFPLGMGYIHFMERVAQRSVEEIRPALGVSAAEFDLIRYRFTTLPFWPILIITVLGLVFGMYFAFQAGSTDNVSSILWGFTSGLGYTLLPIWLYTAYRHVSQIDDLYTKVTKLNLFNLQPLYGLARVAMVVGIFLVVLVNINFLSETYFGSVTQTPEMIFFLSMVGIVASVAVFVIPVLGIHRKIEKDKTSLLAENAEQIDSLRREIQGDMEKRSFKNIDGLEKGLSALLKVRESISAIPTWPWSPGTFGKFASAIVLPLIVWLLQRIMTPLFAVPQTLTEYIRPAQLGDVF
ncbi:MAG: hypothetical protein KF701_08070 [Anaerolineales bacterium]|nr:MAG: hypothetical protein KF701_08070 [Anaerolineales bacterium]